MTMTTAAVLREPGAPLSIEEIELDALQADEVLVRMRGVGICHTDVAAQQGVIPLPLPTVLGHEGSGVVEAVGEAVTHVVPGDHVVLSYDHCGECQWCRRGRSSYCEMFAAVNYFGARLDSSLTMHQGEDEVFGSFFGQSSFAARAIASARNTVKVPADLPIELLGPFGCGLQTGAGSVMNVLRPDPGEGICVFGLGAVGLSAIMAAAALGCDPVIAVDPNAERRALAEGLGATATFDPAASHDLVWDIMAVAAPGVHHSLDAVGTGPVIRQALEVLRSPGHCVTVGFQGLEHEITIDQGHLLLGRRLSGVIEGDADPQEFIPKLIDLHREGRFPYERLVETFPFEAINDALEASESGRVVKPVLVFGEEPSA
jgi:aryl-alcohol dehydrogenase